MTSSYGGIQLFMEKLNQLLINSNDFPLFNNPIIIRERPQFKLMYDELDSMIQALFNDQHEELAELNDLKRRFIDAADEAEYIVDLFLSDVNNNHLAICNRDFNPSLNIDDVMRSFESIKVKFMGITVDKFMLDSSSPIESPIAINQSAAASAVEVSCITINNIQMDSSPRPAKTGTESAAGISYTRNSLLQSKKLLDETIVGFDVDADLLRDKLVEDQKKVDVVSIVGMGGIGKTTLATKVFNDGYVKHHFHVHVWVTVSQTYDKRTVLIQILNSIIDLKDKDIEKTTDSGLRDMVHKHLIGKRYLIVIDDIWHIQAWDEVKLFFPHDNTGSRILLTSRLAEVAKHANPDGFIHHLGYLKKEKSWELLCNKVFKGDECPKWSIKPGMQIVENCKGLPLSVVVIAGVLAKKARSKELWVKIADRTGSYILAEENECLEVLALSYNHLPFHMRECFLYLGGFPEDYKFHVQRLIWLWIAEGFIQQDGDKSLEDIAESYLMDLIDRNLVIVSHKRMYDGAVRACTLHDLVRELCLRKSKEERFLLKTERLIWSSNITTPPYKSVRMFINNDNDILTPHAQNLRSILFLSDLSRLSYKFAKYCGSCTLFRVLDLQRCSLNDFPKGMELLVHLRYLAIRKTSDGFPSSICNLWSLHILIYNTGLFNLTLPDNISNLVNLRHLRSNIRFRLPSVAKPMKLQTISTMELGNIKLINLQTTSEVTLRDDEIGNFKKWFPYVKEIKCRINRNEVCDFESLNCLEKLKLTGFGKMDWLTFPTTLRELTLQSCQLPWSHMSIIQSLPNLQLLKLKYKAFKGSCWNTDGQVFQQLKFLRLEELDIEQWEACTTSFPEDCTKSFPCLRQLEINSCQALEKIPLEIGDIPTLQLITIKRCCKPLAESVRRVEEQQNYLGNYDLNIDIREY